MRNSQKVLLAALGVILLSIVGLVGAVRVSLTDFFGEAGAQEPANEDRVQAILSPNLRNFDRVVVRESWVVDLTQGNDWQVELSYPDDVEVEVGVDGDLLVLDREGGGPGWRWWGDRSRRFRADITMPALSELDIEGAAQVNLRGFEGERLGIQVGGAANIEGYDGRFDLLDLVIAGAANVQLNGILVTDAEVDLSGASNVELRMNGGELTGKMSGFGNLSYSGDVSDERVNVSGFGHVGPK